GQLNGEITQKSKETNSQYGIEVTVHALFKQSVEQNPTVVENPSLMADNQMQG
ncbi:hypothetical protein JL858_18990, partial [Acinetobacter baumannii]|nr:hypothetical protein [Acinetobacter baumannii]